MTLSSKGSLTTTMVIPIYSELKCSFWLLVLKKASIRQMSIKWLRIRRINESCTGVEVYSIKIKTRRVSDKEKKDCHVTNFKFLFEKKRRFDKVKIVESLFQKMFECLFWKSDLVWLSKRIKLPIESVGYDGSFVVCLTFVSRNSLLK